MVTLKSVKDDTFEILDLTDKNYFQKIVADLSKASATKQLVVGGGTGWAAGYLSANVGRTAAMALGGGLLVMQYAHYKGYININWGKLERNTKTKIRKLEKEAGSTIPAIFRQIADFAADNMILAGGFAGGFLIGIAT